MNEKERLLKEELNKIHDLEREVRQIERLEKQGFRSDGHANYKAHEKAKRAITHGEPQYGIKEFLVKSKFMIISIIAAVLLLSIVLIPTKTVERTEPVESIFLEAYNVSEEAWVTENTTITEDVKFSFETKVIAVPTLSGTRTQYVVWEIIIRNFEEDEGCWQYDYTVYVNDEEYDDGTLKNMCVLGEDSKTFTTPLYDLGHVEGIIEYSVEIEPAEIPTRTMKVTTPHTVLKITNVTKYRNTTKVVNLTTNKTVNWLLGFSIF